MIDVAELSEALDRALDTNRLPLPRDPMRWRIKLVKSKGEWFTIAERGPWGRIEEVDLKGLLWR